MRTIPTHPSRAAAPGAFRLPPDLPFTLSRHPLTDEQPKQVVHEWGRGCEAVQRRVLLAGYLLRE